MADYGTISKAPVEDPEDHNIIVDDVEDPGQASNLSSTFNFINTIIGGGTLTIPLAMKQAGLGLGLGLLVMQAFLVCYSGKLLIWASLAVSKTEGEL